MDSANDLTTSSGWFFPTWILLAWFLRFTSWPAEILVFDDLCFELTFSFPVFYEHVSVDLPSSPIRKLRNIAIRWLHWHRKKHNTLWVPEEKQIELQKTPKPKISNKCNTRVRVSSQNQTTRRKLKTQSAAEYFCWTSRCLENVVKHGLERLK